MTAPGSPWITMYLAPPRKRPVGARNPGSSKSVVIPLISSGFNCKHTLDYQINTWGSSRSLGWTQSTDPEKQIDFLIRFRRWWNQNQIRDFSDLKSPKRRLNLTPMIREERETWGKSALWAQTLPSWPRIAAAVRWLPSTSHIRWSSTYDCHDIFFFFSGGVFTFFSFFFFFAVKDFSTSPSMWAFDRRLGNVVVQIYILSLSQIIIFYTSTLNFYHKSLIFYYFKFLIEFNNW